MSISSYQHQFATEKLVLLACQSFNKDISYLKISSKMRKSNNSLSKGLPNVMTVHLYVLCPFMIYWICSYLNGARIITMKWSRISWRNPS